ncbi:hypothetical protein VTJ04DRAFT_8555 [Mycothermus thermophilus]|uniref:uncharacterized protein n=1 Tax=Humicola insolens TaxID=85995 RepID=UPI00374311BF
MQDSEAAPPNAWRGPNFAVDVKATIDSSAPDTLICDLETSRNPSVQFLSRRQSPDQTTDEYISDAQRGAFRRHQRAIRLSLRHSMEA